jgi:sortase A
MNLFPISPKPRSSWVWAERALLLVGIVCLGIWLWVWLDARVFEMEQNEVLDKALAAPAHRNSPPAAETDALGSFQPTGKESAKVPAPEDGELIGRISIPRIGVSAVVVQGVGKRTLRRGAGHIPDTAMPFQQAGNVGIAAHRDSFFRGLKDIHEHDTIELTTLEGTFRYQVAWTRIVKPEDTSVLAPTDEPALTLVTCYPFYYVGSAPKRFVVRAHRIDDDSPAGP